jgi:hypothetical protein
MMEDYRRDDLDGRDKEIAYSRSVKAGKRIYYLDVKRSRNEDLYLSLTESKKKVSGNPENPEISFEKHKIFLYKEDLSKFTEALIDVIKYMEDNDLSLTANDLKQNKVTEKASETTSGADFSDDLDDSEPAIKLDIEDFK